MSAGWDTDSVYIKAILQSAIEVTAELLRTNNIFQKKCCLCATIFLIFAP